MRSKNKRTNQRRRDLEDIKNIKKLSGPPKYNYIGSEYGQSSYGDNPRQRPNVRKEMEAPRASTSQPTRPQRKRQVKKKKTKFFMGRILFFIVFIVGIIYLASIVIETLQKPVISYQMVQRGMIDNSEVFSGLIVRSEKVVINEDAGSMYLIAADGEKVRKNGQVYQVLDSLETLALEEDMQKVESDIEKVQNKRQDMSYYQNEIKVINNQITNHIEEFYVFSQRGKLDKTQELKRQIEYEIRKRKNIHMNDSADALSPLKDQKHDLAAQLSANQKIYKAPEPGIVSYFIDGYEEVFTVETLDKILERDIENEYPVISTTINPMIEVKNPAYKIIHDEKWYMVSFMPESWASRFQEGQNYNFVLIEDNNTEFTLKVEQNELQEGKHKIVFSSREQLDLFSSKRTASFKSTQYIYEGLKIPKSAIIERNLIKIPATYLMDDENGKGVLKKAQGSGDSVFSRINIQFEDDAQYIHVLQNLEQKEALKLGDTVIHPSGQDDLYLISEVSTTKGVYVVNGRITQFKQLNILAENDEYVIANSTTINGLKQFDQIVSNPKNVGEEQLLRDMDVKNTN